MKEKKLLTVRYTTYLFPEQVEYLRSLPNAAAFLRGLIAEWMAKETMEPLLERTPPPKREPTPIETELVESVIEYLEDSSDQEVRSAREHGDTGISSRHPYRYRQFAIEWVRYLTLSVFPLFREAMEINWLEEHGKTNQIEYLRELADSCEIDPDNLERERVEKFHEKLRPVYEEAERRWTSMYPERLRTELTEDYELGDLIIELGGRREVTTQEIAAILGMTYTQVYNRIRPVLENEGFAFVRKTDE